MILGQKRAKKGVAQWAKNALREPFFSRFFPQIEWEMLQKMTIFLKFRWCENPARSGAAQLTSNLLLIFISGLDVIALRRWGRGFRKARKRKNHSALRLGGENTGEKNVKN